MAPSPHDSPPWLFAEEGDDHAFEVHIDPGRRLTSTDPGLLVLSMAGDGRADRPRAGQALQCVLLHAAAHDATAAVHTQPLQPPAPRAGLRTRLTPGRFPQMVLRTGRAEPAPRMPRRPLAELLGRGGPRPGR